MKEIYEIFCKCFPNLPMTMETFRELSEADSCTVSKAAAGDKTVGFAMTKENEIKLICVLPEYQRMGYGRALTELSAEAASKKYGKYLWVGDTGSRLFIGAPEETAGFFEKMGFDFDAPAFAEMSGDEAQLTEPDFPLPGNIRFDIRQTDDVIRKAVAEVDDDWVQYFDRGEVFCAVTLDGDIAAFCSIEEEAVCLLTDGNTNVGIVGCVGTVPKYRRQGIGLWMVYLASKELFRRGCGKIFIHYTYVYDWYARLGFRTFMRLLTGGRRWIDN